MGTTRSGDTLVNVTVDGQGRGQLRRKATGQPAPLKPQAAACAQGGGHQRLSCSSCHTAWAPQCTTCHTAFDPESEGHDHLAMKFVPGEWMETSVDFDAGPPTLGVRLASGRGERGGERVDTFVPGMILTIDRNLQAGQPPDVVFRRLFAPLRRTPRSARRGPASRATTIRWRSVTARARCGSRWRARRPWHPRRAAAARA